MARRRVDGRRGKKLSIYVFSTFFFLPFFLTSLNVASYNSSSKNLFRLVESAPLIVSAKITEVQAAQPGENYFLYEIKISEVLFAKDAEKKPDKADRLWVLQERLFPEDQPKLKSGQAGVFLLSPLPAYTAYQSAAQKGARYVFWGGEAAAKDALSVQDFAKRVQAIMAVRRGERVPDSPRQSLLGQWLLSGELILQENAALALKSMEVKPGFFTAAQLKEIVEMLSQEKFQPQAGQALVIALRQAKAVSALQQVAAESQGPIKWAAVRALEKLGQPLSTQELASGFGELHKKDKARLLKILIRKQNEASDHFLRNFLQSSESFELKRDALFAMGRTGGEHQEAFLIAQLDQLEPRLVAQAAVVLGQMNSEASITKMFELLESEDPMVKQAAEASLSFNKSSLAREYIKANYTRDTHGHRHPKKHFSDGLVSPRSSHGHSHSHGEGHSHTH